MVDGFENNEALSSAFERIGAACDRYASGEIDREMLVSTLSDAPETVWSDKSFSSRIVELLVENDALYNSALEGEALYAELIADMLPSAFWRVKENAVLITEILIDTVIRDYGYASCCDVTAIFAHVPDIFWEDIAFVRTLVDVITKRMGAFDDLGSIDGLFPGAVFENANNVLYTVLSIFRAGQRNAIEFGMLPAAAWQDRRIILMILSNLEDALRSDRYLFTMYPAFRGSNRDYLSSFLRYTPTELKSDKEFILEFMGYEYFRDDLGALYDWIDVDMWRDKSFVTEALELDAATAVYVSDELSEDDEIKRCIIANVDLDWDLGRAPCERIPEWIKRLLDK